MEKRKLFLQLFTEGDDGGTGDGNGDGSGAEGGNNEPMSFDDFLAQEGNQAEFDRRVQKAIDTAVTKAQEKWQALTDDKLSEAERLAKMTKEEKEQYQQKKREKEVNAMRSGVQVGDEIITIGGICGKVVKTKEESLVIQVGADRVKFEIMRWAVSKVVEETEKPAAKAHEEEAEETEVKKSSKPKKLKKAAPAEEAPEEAEEVEEPAEEAEDEVVEEKAEEEK